MKWWADWLVDNPRDHARCPGLTVCQYCHQHKVIDAGGHGLYETTHSTTTLAQHLERNKRGHGYIAPGRPAAIATANTLRRILKDSTISVLQSLANELAGFSTQHFILSAVSWLVENNHPLSEFESPSFRQLIAAANPEAEAALWALHASVSTYVLRLFDFIILGIKQAACKRLLGCLQVLA